MSESSNHCHRIQNLRSCKILKNNPWAGKQPKLKGSRAKGKTYERTILRQLKRHFTDLDAIHYNEWIGYTDSTGSNFCQPDIYILLPSYILLLEIKLTQTENAEIQLRDLYRPLLEALSPGRPVVMVQICKNLRYQPRNEINSVSEAKVPGILYTYHCLGETFNV